MAREHEMSGQPWGTLEELLLACAVKRHGTKSWESIAKELKNRTTAFHSITPQNCLDNFNDLKRRFLCQNDTDFSTLVAELTKIRVAELRTEVQQRDVTIMSLELRVKRMEEEKRERSLTEEADLKMMPSPEIMAGKSADGGERSFNESNSTSRKGELMMIKEKNLINNDGVVEENEEAIIKTEPVFKSEPDPVRTRSVSLNGKLLGEDDNDNYNNNNNNHNNKMVVKKERKISEVVCGLSESRNEFWESKQSSNVQTSATSLSKKMKRRRSRNNGAGTINSGEEPEIDEVKSQPLVKFLRIIRSHRLGWFFERRQRSQETERYKNLIRQHMDLQTIKSRLSDGAYACIQKFFRDLLLLFNNAIIFYKKNSQEHLVAQELRAIVWKEMTDKLQKPPQPMTVKSEPEQQPVSFSKTNKSPTMVVCGKHSSINAISENASKMGDKKERDVDEKPKVKEKKIEGSFVNVEEKGIRTKRRKERSVSGHRNSKTSNKGGEIKHEYGGNELSSHDALEIKVDKRETMVKKRQGAANFLKRMKQNYPSEVVDNEDDVSEDESRDGKGEKQKKGRGGKRDVTTDRVTRSSRGRGTREESGRAKRAVGRPPKRQAEPESSGKRGRDNGENEVGVAGAGRSRKRSRR